jgi:hypothetical protein
MKTVIRKCVNGMGTGNRMSRRFFTNSYLNSNPKETTHFGFKTVATDEKAKLVEDVFSKVETLPTFFISGGHGGNKLNATGRFKV